MRIIGITAKCSDMFTAHLFNNSTELGEEYHGCVPKFFPEEHYGDYIKFVIDIDTGKIINWNKPEQSDLDELFQLVPAEDEE